MIPSDPWHHNFYRLLEEFLAARQDALTDTVMMDASIDGHILKSKPLLSDGGRRVSHARKLLLRDFRAFLQAAGINRPSDLHGV